MYKFHVEIFYVETHVNRRGTDFYMEIFHAFHVIYVENNTLAPSQSVLKPIAPKVRISPQARNVSNE